LITIEEKKPLGTAGGLFLIKNKIKNDFFLTNCDTIINENYNDIYKHHKAKKNDITIVAASKKFKIPYGVCDVKENNFIMREKPELKYNVNRVDKVNNIDNQKIWKYNQRKYSYYQTEINWGNEAKIISNVFKN